MLAVVREERECHHPTGDLDAALAEVRAVGVLPEVGVQRVDLRVGSGGNARRRGTAASDVRISCEIVRVAWPLRIYPRLFVQEGFQLLLQSALMVLGAPRRNDRLVRALAEPGKGRRREAERGPTTCG